MEKEDFVPFMAEVLQGTHQGGKLIEAVGEDDNHAAALDLAGQIVPQGSQRGFAAGFGVFQGAQQVQQVLGAGLRLDDLANPRVVRDQSDGVALMQHQIRQRGGNVLRVLELAVLSALVIHAAGGIDQEVSAEVRLFFVFFDVIAIGFAVGAPIDVADFVTGIVLAMLGELDAEALVGALVDAG